jgi:hypothetical protein
MSTRGGKGVVVVLGKEDSYGAGAATPAGFVIPFASVKFSDAQGYGESDEIQAGANPGEPMEDVSTSQGSLVAALTCGLWALLTKWLAGNLTTTGEADPYTHKGKAQSADPSSVWLERQHTDVTKFDLHKGVRLHGVKIDATKKAGLLKATIDLMGNGSAIRNGGTVYDATPVTFTDKRLNQKLAVAKIDDVTSTLVKSVAISITRGANPQHTMDGTDLAEDVALDGWVVKADITAVWDSADTIRTLADGADHTFALEIPEPGTPTHKVVISLPEAKVYDNGSADVANRGPLEVSVTVVGFYVDNADASSFVLQADNANPGAFYTDA